MKGFKDSNNKFHPITDYKKGVRKSRDQTSKEQGVRLKRKGQLFKPQESRNVLVNKDHVIIWDDEGIEVAIWVHEEWEEDPSAIPAIRNAIRLANQGKVEEIKTMIDFDEFHPVQEKTRPKRLDRKARDEQLQPFVKKNVAENLAELNLFLKDLREEKSMRMREGKPLGIINSDLRLIGGARNSILTLLEQVPEPLHKEIVMETVRIEDEMKS